MTTHGQIIRCLSQPAERGLSSRSLEQTGLKSGGLAHTAFLAGTRAEAELLVANLKCSLEGNFSGRKTTSLQRSEAYPSASIAASTR